MSPTTERWSYTFLLSSLPALPARFEGAKLPISAPALEERIARIPDDDQRTLEAMRQFLFWDRLDLLATDREILDQYDQFMNEAHVSMAKEIVTFRMMVRTIVAALRARRRGMAPPGGVSPWRDIIRRNCSDPSLGLGSRFSWIALFDRQLSEGNVDEADRLLLGLAYDQWSRMAAGRSFSFESFLLYVARWDVLHRFVSRNRPLGEQRMEHLVTEAIGDYRRLF